MASVDLSPLSLRRAPVRRSAQLLFGLVLYGVSTAILSRSLLGLFPWGVLTDGLVKRTGLTFGTITAIVSVFVMLLWIPLRQRPGVGTIANIVVISIAVDLTRAIVPDQHTLIWQITLLVGGVILNAIATAVYVGTRLGPGPRDGLMTGLAARSGRSIRLARTGIEVVVLATGWFLGGTVGVGTVLYALTVGPLTQLLMPLVTWRSAEMPRDHTPVTAND